eukprot:Pgem_evm1s6926
MPGTKPTRKLSRPNALTPTLTTPENSRRKRRGISVSAKMGQALDPAQLVQQKGPQPRSLRFTFSMKTTSSKNAYEVMSEMEKALKRQGSEC